MSKAILLSPEGRASFVLLMVAMLMTALMIFAIAGGALGARRFTRTKRP